MAPVGLLEQRFNQRKRDAGNHKAKHPLHKPDIALDIRKPGLDARQAAFEVRNLFGCFTGFRFRRPGSNEGGVSSGKHHRHFGTPFGLRALVDPVPAVG